MKLSKEQRIRLYDTETSDICPAILLLVLPVLTNNWHKRCPEIPSSAFPGLLHGPESDITIPDSAHHPEIPAG